MADISLTSTVRVNDEVVFRELEGEAVLLNMQTGVYFGLDPVGTRIWQLIEQYGALSTVLEEIVREFDVDGDVARRDLLSLVEQLAIRRLVEIAP